MRRSLIYILALALLSVSCSNQQFEEHKNGFSYMNIDRSEIGLSPRIGDLTTLDVSIKAPNDSLLRRANSFRIQIEKARFKGSINQALMFMHEGDSMAFLIDAVDYYNLDSEETVPEFIKKGDKLRFDIRLTDVKSMEEFEQERRLVQISGVKREEIALKHFLKRSGIADSAAMDRVFVKTLRKGTGDSPKSGDRVAIHYFAYFVDGTPFDNTYERGQTFDFTIGNEKVLEGLERGVEQMQVGEKATIVIPSPLAYGDEGMPEAKIAPYTTLVFDAELKKIK
ncbi:MAG: FKBP-type peptidyl-prolyl cis-trans isomerase [Salinivirgaceae bacterium]|jgi:FKBP-type peptidyl-prolyl cis-trans isomerase FkpA|nr:FKBP-type peptidyl-prolyl cis-trans isomerase [Salinivirgaceae bacterium]